MPPVNPNVPISPGIVTNPNAYPQWGVKGSVNLSGVTSASDLTIKEATNSAEKIADIAAGYGVWFTSQAYAQAFINSEDSALNGTPTQPASKAFSVIGVSGTNLLYRALKIIVGGVLVVFGIVHMMGISGDIAKTVKGVPLPV